MTDDSVIASFEKWTPAVNATSLEAAALRLQMRARNDRDGTYVTRVMYALSRLLGGIDLPLEKAMGEVPFDETQPGATGLPLPEPTTTSAYRRERQAIRALSSYAVNGSTEVLLAYANYPDVDSRALAAVRAFRDRALKNT